MAKTNSIPIELLRQLMDCDFATGKLTWKPRPGSVFNNGAKHTNEHIAKFWNKQFAGKPAFTTNRDGYFVGAIFAKSYSAHRVIWALCYGEWPDGFIDHINGIRSDNRITNLRVVSDLQNAQNSGRARNSSSGQTGVYFIKATGRWKAHIECNKRRYNLGNFILKDDAIAARKQAEIEHGFHPNHGSVRRLP